MSLPNAFQLRQPASKLVGTWMATPAVNSRHAYVSRTDQPRTHRWLRGLAIPPGSEARRVDLGGGGTCSRLKVKQERERCHHPGRRHEVAARGVRADRIYRTRAGIQAPSCSLY